MCHKGEERVVCDYMEMKVWQLDWNQTESSKDADSHIPSLLGKAQEVKREESKFLLGRKLWKKSELGTLTRLSQLSVSAKSVLSDLSSNITFRKPFLIPMQSANTFLTSCFHGIFTFVISPLLYHKIILSPHRNLTSHKYIRILSGFFTYHYNVSNW